VSERVSEAKKPNFKEGDFLHSDWDDENITIIFKNQEDYKIHYHASRSSYFGVAVNDDRYWRDEGDFRPATEAEKQELLDALAKEGKRWNEEKKCIEDIPKRKFRAGDKVKIKDGISSKTHSGVSPGFVNAMDKFIGKELTFKEYSSSGWVVFYGDEYEFAEDWLEPYVEDIPKRKFKKGDKVRIKEGVSSKTHNRVNHGFAGDMDELIGKTMTVDRYTDWDNYVKCEGTEYSFLEEWLEPYVEELKKGDLAIFWNNGVQQHASVRMYGGLFMRDYCDTGGVRWDNAIKFESKEQYEKLIKGEL